MSISELRVPREMLVCIHDGFDNNFGIENDFYKIWEEELSVMFWRILLLQIYFQLRFCLRGFVYFVRLLSASVSINRTTLLHIFCENHSLVQSYYQKHRGSRREFLEELKHKWVNPLTLRVSLEGIVCYSHTFEDNLGIKQKFTKYLKEICCLASDQHLSFKFL